MAGRPVFRDPLEGVADIPDGATIMIGGFAGRGVPAALVLALRERGPRDLTVICNDVSGGWSGRVDPSVLIEARLVRKVICSWPAGASAANIGAFEKQYQAGEIELELVPQGTLAERIRAGGAGIGGFYTPTGVGTVFGEGKEQRNINGVDYVFELPLTADYALIRAFKADAYGNLVYRRTARNFGPPMATAAATTIAEVTEVLQPGELDPECIVTPGIYVQRLVIAEPKR